MYKDTNVAMKTTTFRNTKPFLKHFLYCNAVYDNNKLHHSSPYIEETWITQLWLNQVFSYLVDTSEENALLDYMYFLCE